MVCFVVPAKYRRAGKSIRRSGAARARGWKCNPLQLRLRHFPGILLVCTLALPCKAEARSKSKAAAQEPSSSYAFMLSEDEPPNSTPPADQPDIAQAEATPVAQSQQKMEQQAVTETAANENIDPPPAPDQRALPAGEFVEADTQAQAATKRRFRYSLAVTVRTVYDDNINISNSDRQSDVYATIEPTLNFGFGDAENNFLAFTYSPSGFFFVSHSENNAIQQTISLNAQYRFPRVTVAFGEEIQILDGTGLNAASGTGTDFTRTNLDVSGRTKLNTYSTRLDGNYSLTGKTFLTAGLNYNVSDYASLISSSVVSGNVYFNYTYSPKLSIGVGASAGYNSVDAPSDDQTFEQINFRSSYELTGKASASFSAGFEFRQVANGVSDNGSPVFDGTLFYQPFDGTSISFTLARRTQNSATLAGQNFHSTSATLSARQRFLQRLYLGLSVGYENSSYFTTTSGFDSNRSDDYLFLQASLDMDITRFWTIGLYYFYRESDSSFDLFSFYDNQLGLRTAIRF